MRRKQQTISVHLALALGLIGAGLGTAQTGVSLAGNVSPWVARAQKLRAADDNQPVAIAAYLSFRNQAALENLIIDQSTPGSAKYGQFLTPEQFRAQFAPDPADVRVVQDTLRGLGFTIDYTPESGLFVQASGTVAQVKNAFHVSQDLYSYNGKTLRANAEPPILPASIAGLVTFIAGLDDSRFLVKPTHVSTTSPKGPNAPPGGPFDPEPAVCSTYWDDHSASVSLPPSPYPAHLPWFICGYTPEQFRQAYGADKVSETGRRVRVAVADMYASPTIVADVNRFSAKHGLPPLTYLNFAQIVPPGIYNVPATDPCGPQDWYYEETMDVESVHGMAPDAFILYTGASCTTYPVPEVALYNVIDNRLADIITNSWAWGPEGFVPAGLIQADDAEFKQAVAEGISVLFSSGDSGDFSPFTGIASGGWPASSPWVTAVGGTSLGLKNASGEKSEWGWGSWITLLNNPSILDNGKEVVDSGLEFAFGFYAGSGGGASFVEPQPYYQKGVVPSKLSNQTYLYTSGQPVPLSPPRRVTPDISMDGDPFTGALIGETFTITGDASYDTGCKKLSSTTEYCERDLGGTSLSSPLFAGVLALVNEERLNNSLNPIGFANPALYKLTKGAEGSSAPIIDVLPPSSPIAVVGAFVGPDFIGYVSVTSINSAPNASGREVIEGADADYWLLTMKGYDAVTGLGTPNVPALIQALGSH